jgi:hypothetical protein
MALAAALAAPDTLSGIIALAAMLPPVAGWSPPLASLEALPVLIAGAHPLAQRRIGVLCGESLADRLRQWGADPIVLPDLPEPERTAAIAGWLARQRPRYGGPQENDS